MKAAVLFETGQPLEVVTGVQLPALQTGQIRVKVNYSGLCHSQLAEVSRIAIFHFSSICINRVNCLIGSIAQS